MKSNSTPKDLAKTVYQRLKGARIIYPQPNQSILDTLFENLFYTSLKTEEGLFIKVTITLIDPDNPDPSPPKRKVADRWNFIHFEEKLPFTVKNLVKLSKAADPWSSSLAVYYSKTELYIWGLIDQAIHYQSFLNYEANSGPEQPGLFQTTITGIGSLNVIFDYELIASLKQNTLISKYIDVFRFGPVNSILKLNSSRIKKNIEKYIENNFEVDQYLDWDKYCQNTINQSISRILLRIKNYHHGGAILFCDVDENNLDIKYKIEYSRFHDSIKKLLRLTIANTNYSDDLFSNYIDESSEEIPTQLYLEESVSQNDMRDTQDELKGAIRFISSLSCVDGLITISKDFIVFGFGAIIKANEIPDNIYISKSGRVNESRLQEFNTNHFGTRHRSMFSYCWNNLGSLGFVISQDGDIRAITRVNDKLIMWENIKVQQYSKSRKLKRLIDFKAKLIKPD